MSKNTKKSSVDKPSRPYPDFPLFPHATGRWAKKIRGKSHYFGPWRDPQGALEKYLEQKDALHAGRTPRAGGKGLTVRELVNRFLTSKKQFVDSGELIQRSFQDYYTTCKRIVEVFGRTRLVDDLAADDFESLRAELAKTRGPVTLGNEIQRVRIVFKYAYDAGLIDKPIRYGPAFKRPSKRILRLDRASKGSRMFQAHELQAILEAARPQFRAMLLLGINCGFGNTDVAALPLSAVDLGGGWINYPRPKTGVDRRVPLWPETMEALREAIATRPTPNDEADSELLFITKYGKRWKTHSDKPISKECAKLLKDLNIYRPGLAFYALRHTFRTVADEVRDQPAIDYIMGHAANDMASVYRERISDERLIAVTNYVREWLFGDHSEAAMPGAAMPGVPVHRLLRHMRISLTRCPDCC